MEILNFVKKLFQGRFQNVTIAEVIPYDDMYFVIGAVAYFNSFIATMTKDFKVSKFRGIKDSIIFNRISGYGDHVFISGSQSLGNEYYSLPTIIVVDKELNLLNKVLFDPDKYPNLKEKKEDIYFEDICATEKSIYLTCRILSDFSKSIVVKYDNTLTKEEISPIVDMGEVVNYTRIGCNGNNPHTLMGWVLERPPGEGHIFPIPKKKFEIRVDELFGSQESLSVGLEQPGG